MSPSWCPNQGIDLIDCIFSGYPKISRFDRDFDVKTQKLYFSSETILPQKNFKKVDPRVRETRYTDLEHWIIYIFSKNRFFGRF